MIRLDRLLLGDASAAEYANGGHDRGTPAANELPGNIDEPIGLTRSADGTAFTTTLLEGVMLKEVLSRYPKYIDVHAAGIEAPQALACADLDERGQRTPEGSYSPDCLEGVFSEVASHSCT